MNSYRPLFTLLLIIFALAIAAYDQTGARQTPTQNILWINIDDQSPWYGTYGDELAQTPVLDALAEQGVVFERAYAASPVCAPSRTAIITGSYAIRTGTL